MLHGGSPSCWCVPIPASDGRNERATNNNRIGTIPSMIASVFAKTGNPERKTMPSEAGEPGQSRLAFAELVGFGLATI